MGTEGVNILLIMIAVIPIDIVAHNAQVFYGGDTALLRWHATSHPASSGHHLHSGVRLSKHGVNAAENRQQPVCQGIQVQDQVPGG